MINTDRLGVGGQGESSFQGQRTRKENGRFFGETVRINSWVCWLARLLGILPFWHREMLTGWLVVVE